MNITNASRSSRHPGESRGPALIFCYSWIPAFAGMTILLLSSLQAFQTDFPGQQDLTTFDLIESGLATEKNMSPPFFYLANGDYAKGLGAATQNPSSSTPWLTEYLTGLNKVFPPLVRFESEHFILWTPADQTFLKDYALPSLEKSAAYLEKAWGHRPKEKIRVEIYPTKEDFSVASTLSLETLERSGAIGICKFHRLMIMSPKTLPLGYRWLDALSHEYLHLNINEVSHAKAELWLHEGTARYFETAYRLQPPVFLTPDQKTKLLEAQEKDTLVPFARMSPSMVYLKDQEQVSLAFAQVSHAVSMIVKDHGVPAFVKFLKSLKQKPFAPALKAATGDAPPEFEIHWKEYLAKEKWEKSKGTMSDEVAFTQPSEDSLIGADSQAQVRLGDRMRRQNLFEGALIQYEKALEVEPDNAIILLKAAKTQLALNEKEKAIALLRRATEKNPNYITPHIELALLVNREEALPHLMEALSINPFDPRIQKRMDELK